MLTKLSVDQVLMKARSNAKKGDFAGAQNLYQTVLQTFPKNQRAQQELATLKKSEQDNATQNPSQDEVNQLVALYNQMQFSEVVDQALIITKQYPKAFIVWNVLGASAAQIGMLDKAIEAYNKCILFKPEFVDAYYNMGNVLQEQGHLDEAITAYNKAISIKPDYADAYINMGNTLKDQGKLEQAIEVFNKALSLKPNYANAYNNLGVTLQKLGNVDQAITAYNKAISLKPDYADPYNNMGNTLKNQGKLDQAITAYKKAITLKPDYAKAYCNLGVALKDQDKLEEAIECYDKALSLKPSYAEAYCNMGVALKNQGKLDEAINAYTKALSLKPNYTKAYNNLGVVLKDQGRLDEAITAYNNALSIKPDYADAYSNLGATLQDQGKLEEAIEAFNKALLLKPDYANTYSNMGVTLQDQGKLEEAIEAFNKALILKPDFADAYSNMGVTLHHQGKLNNAIDAYNQSISLKPNYVEAHQNLSFALLCSGKIKEGLDENEWRKKDIKFLSNQRHFLQPLWDGKKSLNNKRILIWCEQGIGDTINWSSCLPLVASQAKHCILECQEKLVPLLERSFPDVEVKPEKRCLDAERDDFDFHLPMGSLYRLFMHEIIQNTKVDSYLIPDPVRVDFWKERLNSIGKGPYIGISWKSSVVSHYRLQHYPPISDWSQILTIPGVTFINLQYTDFVNDLAEIQDEFGVTVHNFGDLDHYANIDDVAALYAALDIVVSTKVTPSVISSGVGTLTKIANWRQSVWNNFLVNPVSSSVEMFERNTWEPWDNVFRLIAESIFELKKKTTFYKDKL